MKKSDKKRPNSFVRALAEITVGIINTFKYSFLCNLNSMAWTLELCVPYGMYIIGQNVALSRGHVGFGGELLIPVVVFVVTYYMREYANRKNKGARIPVPDTRFTTVDDDGEVSIRNDRVQELILYLADLEDWMERKGML